MAGVLVVVYTASLWVGLGCGKIGCGKKEEKKPLSQAMVQDTTFSEIATGEQPDLSSLPPGPSVPQVVTDAEGNYTVQVSSWRSRRNAEHDAQRYISQGFTAYVQRAYVQEKYGTWYRVRVGSFATQAEAEQMAAQLAGLLESGFWIDRVRQDEPPR
jgi:cell division protein FtsN